MGPHELRADKRNLLTVSEVARRLACSPNQVRALISAGRLTALDLGVLGLRRQSRVSEEELARFIQRPAEAPPRE